MKLKNYEIENFVKTLKPLKNMILLYGADEGLVYNRSKTIIKAFLGNVYDKNSLNQINDLERNVIPACFEIAKKSTFGKPIGFLERFLLQSVF